MLACEIWSINWIGTYIWSIALPCLCPHLVIYGVLVWRYGMMERCVGGVLFSIVVSRCLGGGLSLVLMVCVVCVLVWV